MADRLTDRLDEMLRTEDRAGWRAFLDTCTMQEAWLAYLKAAEAGVADMRVLAFKRQEHLNGEHRHPELWS